MKTLKPESHMTESMVASKIDALLTTNFPEQSREAEASKTDSSDSSEAKSTEKIKNKKDQKSPSTTK